MHDNRRARGIHAKTTTTNAKGHHMRCRSPYVPVHFSLESHPKYQRFMRRTGKSKDTCTATLVRLWRASIEYDISDWTAEDVKAAVEWRGNADELLKALLEVGFLDRESDGQLNVHEKHEYAGKKLTEKIKERDRGRARRNAKARSDVHRTSMDVHRISMEIQPPDPDPDSEFKKRDSWDSVNRPAQSMPTQEPQEPQFYNNLSESREEKDSKEPVLCIGFNATEFRAPETAPPQRAQDRRKDTEAGVGLETGGASILEPLAKRGGHPASGAETDSAPRTQEPPRAAPTPPPRSTDGALSPTEPTTVEELLAAPYRGGPLLHYLRGAGLYQDDDIARAAAVVMRARPERACLGTLIAAVKCELNRGRRKPSPVGGTLLCDTPAWRVISAIGGLQ